MKAYWEKRLKQYDKYVAGTWTGKNVDKMLEEVFRIKAQLIDKSQYQSMEYYVTKGYSGNRFSKFFQRTSKGTIKFAKNIPSELKQQFTERIFENVREVMEDDFQSKNGFEYEVSARIGKDITFTQAEWAQIQELAEQRRQQGQSFRDSLYDVLKQVADTFNMEWDFISIIKSALKGDGISLMVSKKLINEQYRSLRSDSMFEAIDEALETGDFSYAKERYEETLNNFGYEQGQEVTLKDFINVIYNSPTGFDDLVELLKKMNDLDNKYGHK